MMKIKILNAKGETLYISEAKQALNEVYSHEYSDGDWFNIDFDKTKGFYKVSLDDSMMESIIYVPTNLMTYYIPKSNNRYNYSPKSFYGNTHIIKLEEATKEEIYTRRNLSLNPFDEHENNSFFPHSFANIETRGECSFASRNAIDGIIFNKSHGAFPYQSWGINRDPNAEYTLDFGRYVVLDELKLTLRADFPHDSYWTNATVEFSDGSAMVIKLTKTSEAQSIKLDNIKTTSLKLKNLIKADDESPFPALSQIEAWGVEAKE